MTSQIGVALLACQMAFGQAAPARRAAPPAAMRTVKDLKFGPLPELKLPEVTTFTLANGMKVYLLENHELPLVRGSARIRAGNVHDPANKTGLSDIFGEVLRTGGTQSKTGDQLNEMLEGIAAVIESDVGETSATIGFNTLTEHTGKVLDTFKEILTEPAFSQDKIDILKNQYRGVIARRNDQPSPIASREFERLMYGPTTPWGRQMEYETLENITRGDLFAYHKRFYFPANILLSVQGDFETAAMRAQIEKLFADWTVKEAPAPPLPPVLQKAVPGAFLASKTDVNQTFFRLGHLGGRLDDKDYAALEVMNDILGGAGFTSRLMKKVRSDMGLAYGVSSGWNAQFDHTGTFVISGSTKSESTVDTIRAVLGEVERIRSTEVTDEELRVAKDSTINSFVFNFDSPSKTLGRLVTYDYFGYPKDFLFQYQKALAAVTKADVLRVAKQYLRPEEFTLVAVGNPAEFKTPLESLNLPVKKIDLTIPEPKRAQPAASAETLARGKQLLEKLQQAVGGAGKLAAVRDYSHNADVKLLSVPGGMKATQVTRILPPQVRFEQKLPFGAILVYSDGKGGGWLKGPQGAGPLPPQVVRQANDELFRMHPALWLSDQNPDRKVNAVGPNTVEITDAGGNWIKLEFDPKTGLVAKSNFRGPDNSESEAAYGDWKEVDGIKLPHQWTIQIGGKPAAEITVTEYKINTSLTVEELSKQP